jgi:hypothetical protein
MQNNVQTFSINNKKLEWQKALLSLIKKLLFVVVAKLYAQINNNLWNIIEVAKKNCQNNLKVFNRLCFKKLNS